MLHYKKARLVSFLYEQSMNIKKINPVTKKVTGNELATISTSE